MGEIGMARRMIFIGGLAGMLSIALGAFGAHGLKPVLDASDLDTFHTGVEYQMYHGIALVLSGILASLPAIDQRWIRLASYGFLAGIILFSGSLYIVSLTDIRGMGMVAPFGGFSLMFGWLCLIISARKLVRRS